MRPRAGLADWVGGGLKPTLLALMLGLVLLGACGKKGVPAVPGPQSEVIYPKQYPAVR